MKPQIKLLILCHIIFWSLELFIEFSGWRYSLWGLFYDELVVASLFYFNYFILVPKIIKFNKPWSFLLWAISYFSLFTIVIGNWWAYLNYIYNPEFESAFFKNIGYFIHNGYYHAGTSLALRLAYDWVTSEGENKSLIEQKTSLQLEFLKSNINIPFTRSILSWAEAHTEDEPEKVEDSIIQLSDVLRYSLYNVKQKSIYLSEEMKILAQYIKLINLIFPKLNVTIELVTTHHGAQTIPNLMLKTIGHWIKIHGNSLDKKTTITIKASEKRIELTLPITDQTNTDSFIQDISTTGFIVKTHISNNTSFTLSIINQNLHETD